MWWWSIHTLKDRKGNVVPGGVAFLVAREHTECIYLGIRCKTPALLCDNVHNERVL
jgi:isocitrate/isopropylmalate dehydrogenase